MLPNKTANVIKTRLESVSLTCKSHRSKTANTCIANPQILGTEASFFIYDNVIASETLIRNLCDISNDIITIPLVR